VELAEPVVDVLPVTDPILDVIAVEESPPAIAGTAPSVAKLVRRIREPASEALWWRGNCVNGLNAQPGVIVLRKDLVAFVPSGEAKNLIGVLAGGVADAVSPIQTVSLEWLRSRPDVVGMIQDLWDERRDDFDVCLVGVAKQLGGFA
jgi:hypothetical protein